MLAQVQTVLLLHGLLDPNAWIDRFGGGALWGVALIIFIECWLFPFLPGDSLLFVLGLLISQDEIPQPLWFACVVVTVAAVLSNVVGYLVGAKLGPALFDRPNSRIFKPVYIEKTHAFFDRHGNRAIVLARFVPIVRTFITLAAGAAQMPMRRFVAYSAIGGVLWACGLTLLGYYLGQVGFLGDHIDLVLLIVVGLSVVPMLVEYVRSRSRRDEATSTARHADPTIEDSGQSPGIILRHSGRGAAGSASMRNSRHRADSSVSPIRSDAAASAPSDRRNPWLGSWLQGIGPCPFHPFRRSASRPR